MRITKIIVELAQRAAFHQAEYLELEGVMEILMRHAIAEYSWTS